MTKNLVIYEKTLSMIEYGTIALQQFPKHEKFVLAAMVRNQMYQVLKLIVETNKRTYRKTALTELDIAHETLRHLVELAYRRLKTMQKMYQEGRTSLNTITQRIRSWLGHCCHADADSLVRHILDRAVFTREGEYTYE